MGKHIFLQGMPPIDTIHRLERAMLLIRGNAPLSVHELGASSEKPMRNNPYKVKAASVSRYIDNPVAFTPELLG